MDKDINLQEVMIDVAKNTQDINRLTKNIEDLTRTVTIQTSQTNKAIDSLGTQLHSSIQELSAQISKQAVETASQGKFEWRTFATFAGVGVGILSVTVSIMVVLGSMSLDPIKQNLYKLENSHIEQNKNFDSKIQDMRDEIRREYEYKLDFLEDKIKESQK